MSARRKGQKPGRVRLKRHELQEDEFSQSLKKQGEEGKIMMMLYLRNPMTIYARKVSDEPIQH